jgi:hypothetical protein
LISHPRGIPYRTRLSPLMKGSRMQRVSIIRRLGQRWMIVVALAVVAVAGLAVYRLNGIFASQDVTSTPSGSENDIVPFNPKHVVMEVFGPPGTVATVTYLDVNAQPQHADAVTLPWAYDTTTTQPAVFVNVSAQGNSDSIGCRIKIDNAVKDERSVNTLNAFTYCLDKSG